MGFEGCFKGVYGSFLSLSCFLLTRNINSLDHWDTCIVTLGFVRLGVFFEGIFYGCFRAFKGIFRLFMVLS